MLPIKYRPYFFWFFCATLIAFSYSPSLNGPYLLDDTHTLSSNAFIQSFSGLSSIWSTGRAYSSLPATYGYRPVTTTVNMILWAVGDGATWPFHVAKIFLFFLTCCLLARMWRILMPWVSPEVIGASVLLFALNPVHSQVVSYIAAIATQCAALFVCASALSYLQFRKTASWRWHLTSLICALLAILSKEEGIVVIGLIPLIELYLRKIEGSHLFATHRLIALTAFLIPAVVGVGLIFWMFEPTQNLVRTDTTTWAYFMTQWRAYLRYFAMYFYSYSLNGDNLEFGFSSNFLNWKVLSALIVNLTFIGAVILFWRRKPALTLALVWFYIGVSPASSIVILSEPVNDHRAFIGYFGFAIFGILLLNWLQERSRILFFVTVATVACTYSVMTYQRGDVWSTSEKFWADTVAKNPSSARAHNNLGLEMIQQKKYQRALDLLERCSLLTPTYSICYINRAVAYSQIGKDAFAEENFALAVKFDMSVIPSRFNWAKFLLARGQFLKAQALLSEADQFAQGQNLDVRLDLIEVLRQRGDLGMAKTLVLEAVSTFGRQPRIVFEARRLGLDY